MDDLNPYAAPQHELPLNAAINEADRRPRDVWRDGNLLVMRKGTLLPDRCVECNTPAEGGRFKLISIWFDPAYLFLLPILPLILPLIAHMTIDELGFCEGHLRQRQSELSDKSPLYFIGGIVLVAAPFFGDRWLPIPFWWRAPIMLAAGAVMIVVSVRRSLPRKRVWACKIDRDYAWYKHVDPNYLAQFPPFPG